MSRRTLIPFLVLLSATHVVAQGTPSLTEGPAYLNRRWSWEDMGGGAQSWDIAQAPNGLLFVANQTGLLEFDGDHWRIHAMPVRERPMVSSVAVDEGGTVYVGGVGDIGRLVPDSTSTLHYESLKEHLAPEEREFADVWTTHATPGGIVFQSPRWIFRWNGRRMQSWQTESRFRKAFLVNDRLIVAEEGVGLRELRQGRLQMIRYGRAFADKKVEALVPHGDDLVAFVRDEGLVRIGRRGLESIEGAGSTYLQTFRPYTAVVVPNLYEQHGDLFAVATIGGGVAIVNPDGGLVRVYREDAGMTSEDYAVGLELDEQGGLWVALTKGIVRIDLFSRSSWFDETEGLLGSVQMTQWWKGALYAATSSGLYRLQPGRLGRPGKGRPAYARFEPVAGISVSEQVWSLDPTEHGLLVASNSGVYVVQGERVRRVSESGAALSFLALASRPSMRFVGRQDGLQRLVLRDGAWTDEGLVAGIDGEVRYMLEDALGRVWVSQPNDRVYLITGIRSGTLRVQEFGPANGLSITAGPLARVGNEVWMAPREGVHRLELDGSSRMQLTPVSWLSDLSGVYALYSVEGDLWVYRDGVIRLLRGEVEDNPGAFHLRNVQVTNVRRDEDGVVWVATVDGLLRYDPRVRTQSLSHPAYIRSVTDRQRRTLYGGAGRRNTLIVPYGDNSEIRFEAAAAFFGSPDAVEYQFHLDGWDSDWGTWGPERVASFTNLWEGDYTLHVRARDAYGQISDEATFSFQVLPPWYRTWWAYGLYLVGAGVVIWGLSTWRVQAHRRKLAVQRAQSARLQRLSTRLEKTNARLRQADQLKDDLLANTSHELRTPLTAILGFSEMLLDEADDDSRMLVEGIHRGGQRLLGTVNGLLDMFKLQSGTMPIEVQEVDVVQAVRESVSMLQPLAAAQGLDLHVIADRDSLRAAVDPGLLERVVTNLVANAIKFTPSGRVLVMVDGDDGDLRIAVRDTGIGIAPDDLARIFEPFEQASTGYRRTHEGTGLGLAIVKRVLDLVDGRISVESEVGQGTTITVTMPRTWGAATPSVDITVHHPTLEGAHVLGMGLDDATLATLRGWIEPHGEVCGVDSIGRAVREARKSVYDTVMLAASDAEQETKWTVLMRSTPGYERVPVLRVGGKPLTQAELTARGFVGQVGTPLHAEEMVDLLEELLARVEAAVPA